MPRALPLVLAALMLPAAVAGCLRAEDACIQVFVERGLSDAGEAQFVVTKTLDGPWRTSGVYYNVYPIAENSRLAAGLLSEPSDRVAFEDADPVGRVSAGDVLRYLGNATAVGGVEFSDASRVIGGTVRCA